MQRTMFTELETQYLVKLERLNACNSNLSYLRTIYLKELRYLNIQGTKITALIFPENSKLETLWAKNAKLQDL